MNGTHQVLAYADDVNLIGDDIRIIKNADMLLNACKDIGLAVNTGKTKYMEIVRHGVWNPEVQCRIHKGSPITPILNRINSITHIDTYLLKFHSNLALSSTPWPP